MRIYLTGFMGSGKSYTGRLLAKRRGVPFIDLDDRIEALAGLSISAIFEGYGEAVFRDLETQTLRSLTSEDCVVATGGGAPCFNGNGAYMEQTGVVVFLDPSIDIMVDRLTAERGHRPLLSAPGDLRNLIRTKLATRRTAYEQASIQVTYDEVDLDLVGTLQTLLKR